LALDSSLSSPAVSASASQANAGALDSLTKHCADDDKIPRTFEE
jgi:hypothetical protein